LNIFFDTSALAKHYVNERGSDEADKQFSTAENAIVAAITKIELFSALSKAHRTNRLNDDEYQKPKTEIDEDFRFCTVIPINETIEQLAIESIQKYSLKTLDAIQYASCINQNNAVEKSHSVG